MSRILRSIPSVNELLDSEPLKKLTARANRTVVVNGVREFLDRLRQDVSEELDRLAIHLDAAAALLAQGGVIGRRLDFLAQELAREANTLTAKAQDPALTASGLALKNLVEQFREQIQNVE